jgi:biotin carboxylase
VPLADALSEALGLPGNGKAQSEARRDKYLMNEVLRRRGVPAVEQMKSNRIDELCAWALERQRWPVVAKPPASSGTDHVTFCDSVDELRAAAKSILASPNFLNEENREVLVQEFLAGDEYIVNSVSWAGRHFVTDIWRCPKVLVDGAPLYDMQRLVAYDDHRPLVEYVLRALDALDIQYGPAHAEAMVTAAGPRLLEVGARVEGSMNPAAVAMAVGHDQVSITIEAYVAPAAFEARLPFGYQIAQHCACVVLMSPCRGILHSLDGLDAIRALESFFSINWNVGLGQVMLETRDLLSSPGHVYLVHEDPAVVDRDWQSIRQMERQGLYGLEPAD